MDLTWYSPHTVCLYYVMPRMRDIRLANRAILYWEWARDSNTHRALVMWSVTLLSVNNDVIWNNMPCVYTFVDGVCVCVWCTIYVYVRSAYSSLMILPLFWFFPAPTRPQPFVHGFVQIEGESEIASWQGFTVRSLLLSIGIMGVNGHMASTILFPSSFYFYFNHIGTFFLSRNKCSERLILSSAITSK